MHLTALTWPLITGLLGVMTKDTHLSLLDPGARPYDFPPSAYQALHTNRISINSRLAARFYARFR